MSSLQLKVNTCWDKADPQDGRYWAQCFHQHYDIAFFAYRVETASRKGQNYPGEKLLPPLGTGTAD